MGRVTGVKEKLHYPLYDAVEVPANQNLGQVMAALNDTQALHFFTNLQNKTRLETNLHQPGQLPSQNTFEARALRIVTSRTGQLPVPPPPAGAVRAETDAFISALIFNSVTTLFVGEKVMIEAPTYYFPSGAGVAVTLAAAGGFASHGSADPMATFRFSEPVTIEPHQNFRVDVQFPRQPLPLDVQNAWGNMRVWCVLDGYMTRDVQ